jgi:peptidoglycan-N-acetylglucosamine deacetylase
VAKLAHQKKITGEKSMPFKNFIAVILLLHFTCSAVYGEGICAVSKTAECVALTFDDGPNSETTPQILESLARFGARATFFVTGENAQSFPEILREIVRSGNEVGNHTCSHPNLIQVTETIVCGELEQTQNLIFGITGCKAVVFRPPYSKINKNVEHIAEELGLRIIIWSVSPADWLDPSPRKIAERVLSVIKAGDIVVMHDGCYPKVKEKNGHPNTAAALPLILEGLKLKGLRPVTVSELLNK